MQGQPSEPALASSSALSWHISCSQILQIKPMQKPFWCALPLCTSLACTVLLCTRCPCSCMRPSSDDASQHIPGASSRACRAPLQLLRLELLHDWHDDSIILLLTSTTSVQHCFAWQMTFEQRVPCSKVSAHRSLCAVQEHCAGFGEHPGSTVPGNAVSGHH